MLEKYVDMGLLETLGINNNVVSPNSKPEIRYICDKITPSGRILVVARKEGKGYVGVFDGKPPHKCEVTFTDEERN